MKNSSFVFPLVFTVNRKIMNLWLFYAALNGLELPTFQVFISEICFLSSDPKKIITWRISQDIWACQWLYTKALQILGFDLLCLMTKKSSLLIQKQVTFHSILRHFNSHLFDKYAQIYLKVTRPPEHRKVVPPLIKIFSWFVQPQTYFNLLKEHLEISPSTHIQKNHKSLIPQYYFPK